MGVSESFRALIRAVVGLPSDPGAPPDLMRLGLYRARVDAVAEDGATVDVTPEDPRISRQKNAKLLVGIPGSESVVKPGAVVHLGWERGDPAKPYCTPLWESGATVEQLIINAVKLYLGGQDGALAAARKTDTVDMGTLACNGVSSAFAGLIWVPPGGGPSVPITTVAVQLTAKISGGSTVVSIK